MRRILCNMCNWNTYRTRGRRGDINRRGRNDHCWNGFDFLDMQGFIPGSGTRNLVHIKSATGGTVKMVFPIVI